MADIAGTYTAASPATLTFTEWWLKNPLDATYNLIVVPAMEDFTRKRKEEHSVYEPLGRGDYIVVRGVIRTERFAMTLEFTTLAEFQKFEHLREQQATLLLQRGYTNEGWYGVIAGDYEVKEARFDSNYRLVSFEFVETVAP